MKVGEAKVGMAVKYRNDPEECWEHFVVEQINQNDNETGIYREKIIVSDGRLRVFYSHNLVKCDDNDKCKKFHNKRLKELETEGF
jgi:hypothetical protein